MNSNNNYRMIYEPPTKRPRSKYYYYKGDRPNRHLHNLDEDVKEAMRKLITMTNYTEKFMYLKRTTTQTKLRDWIQVYGVTITPNKFMYKYSKHHHDNYINTIIVNFFNKLMIK